jgi:hypothetical protein
MKRPHPSIQAANVLPVGGDRVYLSGAPDVFKCYDACVQTTPHSELCLRAYR